MLIIPILTLVYLFKDSHTFPQNPWIQTMCKLYYLGCVAGHLMNANINGFLGGTKNNFDLIVGEPKKVLGLSITDMGSTHKSANDGSYSCLLVTCVQVVPGPLGQLKVAHL